MRPLSPMGFVLALVLHAGIALIAVIWSWYQPKPKPPPAIFEMVAAPAAMEDSVETGNTSPEPVPQNLFRPGRYRPINIPKVAPLPAPEPEPAPPSETRQKTPPKDAPREKASAKRESAKETKTNRQTLADFQKQQPRRTTSTSARSGPQGSPVKAPTIDAREVTSGLRSAMGNSSSRSRVQSLSTTEQRELNEYYALLHAMLQNAWMAPPGVQGRVEVTVVFTVTASGAITAASVSSSSGSAVFDESALQVFQTIRSFPPTPNGQAWTFEVPFSVRD